MKTKFKKMTKEERKKFGRKRPYRNLLIVSLIGIITGVAIGVYFNSNKLDPNRYNFDVSTLVDDVNEIKLEAATKNPEQLGATKSCVLAFDTTFNYPKVSIVGKGVVSASVGFMTVDQTIDAKTIRLGNKLFFENVSISSFVKALNRYYVTDDVILHHSGTLSGNEITWNQSPDNTQEGDIKTMADYKAKYECTMNEYMNYIVSSKTVVTESEVTINADGNYVFTLTLDKSKSVVRYVKTMKDTGGLSEYPNFTSDPQISLIIDSQYRILEFTSNETYKANVGISANSTATLTNKFTYDEDFIIPDITQKTII